MTFSRVFSTGFSAVNRRKRFLVFAWLVNALLAMTLAIPLLHQLDGYLRGTVREEELLERMDANWFRSYQMDFERSEVAQRFDYSVFGSAPFFESLDAVLHGDGVRAVGGFIVNLVTKFRIDTSGFTNLSLLLLLSVLVSTFLAGGFISAYANEQPLMLGDFLSDGAKYFGRLFRLSLLSIIVYYTFFALLVDWANHAIPAWTATSKSEMTPFVLYMVRNVVEVFILALLIMWFDYAKIRIVLDDRFSAVVAFIAAAGFSLRNFGKTFGLYFLLTGIGILLIAAYALLESFVRQNGYWTILAVFVLQQVYMFLRFWLKASFYATQTMLYRERSREEYTAEMNALSKTVVA